MYTASRLRQKPSLLLLPTLAFALLFLLRSALITHAAPAQPQAPQALGTIAGQVTDANGQPLAGIGVGLLAYGTDPVVQISTTADGAFAFSALFPGVYGLRAVDPAGLYATQYYTATNDPMRATDLIVNGNALTGLTFRLQRAGAISGRVTAGGALPLTLPQVDNQAYLYSAQESAQEKEFMPLQITKIISATGRYTFSALLPAVYHVCASVYLPVAGNVFACYGADDLGAATPITVTSGVTQMERDFDIDQGQFAGALSGRVSLRGSPVANIRVDLQGFELLYPLNLYTLTNAAGVYAFRGLPAGSYSARFSDPAERYPSLWHDQQPAGPGAPSLYFKEPLTLQNGVTLSNVNMSLIEYGAIQGRAYRLAPRLHAGDTITVSLIYVDPENTLDLTYHPVVDAAGTYSITRLFPGQYTIAFPYCYPFFEGTACRWRYYGEDPTQPGRTPPPLTIASGQVLTEIDSLIGPDPQVYLPMIVAPTE